MSTATKRILLGVLLLIVAGAALYLAFRVWKAGNPPTAPVVFYERSVITRFDDAGNPYGTSALYRMDGVRGQRRRVLSLDAVHPLSSVNSQFSIQNGKLLQRLSQGSDQITKAFDFSGDMLQEVTDPLAAPSPMVLLSPDGTFKATAALTCAQEVREGPCPAAFRVAIEKNSATVKVVEQKDFSLAANLGYQAQLVAFSKDNKQLFLFVKEAGDASSPSVLFSVDLENFAATAKMTTGYADAQRIVVADRLQFLRRSADDSAIFVERDFGQNFTEGELLKITLSPWKVEKIISITPSSDATMLQPDDAGIVQQKFNGGFSYLDFSTKATTVLSNEGYFLDWSHDGNYYLYRVFDDNHDGLGPYRLMIGSLTTGQQDQILRQTVTAQAFGTSTKVGDVLYAPVGIW